MTLKVERCYQVSKLFRSESDLGEGVEAENLRNTIENAIIICPSCEGRVQFSNLYLLFAMLDNPYHDEPYRIIVCEYCMARYSCNSYYDDGSGAKPVRMKDYLECIKMEYHGKKEADLRRMCELVKKEKAEGFDEISFKIGVANGWRENQVRVLSVMALIPRHILSRIYKIIDVGRCIVVQWRNVPTKYEVWIVETLCENALRYFDGCFLGVRQMHHDVDLEFPDP